MENNFVSTASNLNQAILYLYSSCDLHSSNQVPLSKLLGFINSPKFVEEFAEVREQFYLNGETLGVSSEMFVRIVCEWVRSTKGSDTSTRAGDETDCNLGCNTITSERVKELNHKNKQLHNELDYTKSELAHLDEQYNLLQIANDKLSQEIVRCNKTIIELSSTRGDTQELSVVIEEYEKTVHKLKKALADAEKDNAKMKNRVLNTAHTNDQLQETVKARTKTEEVMSQLIADLEIKLLEKEGEVSELFETNSKLQAEMDEQSQLVLYYTEQDRLQKDQIKQMDVTIQEYRWRFSILNTTVFSSPKPQSPRPQILTEIFNFNSPRLLRTLANPVSPTLDLTNGLNDSDEASAQLLISRCSNNNVSLYDEMVIADEERRSLEYENLIAQQKSRIQELEDALKIAEERTTRSNLEIKAFETSIENERGQNICRDARKMGDKKIGNFGKMEAKLEKREAKLEYLNDLLVAEKRIVATLEEENRNLVRENAILLEEKSRLLTNFESLERLDTNTELDQLTNQIREFDRARDHQLLKKIIDAVENDSKTIESRCTSRRRCYSERVENCSKKFEKLKFMLEKIQERVENVPIDDCLRQLDDVIEFSTTNMEVATCYGRVLRERDDLKYLSFFMNGAMSDVDASATKLKFRWWPWVMVMFVVCIFIVYTILSYKRIYISFTDKKPNSFVSSVT